MCGINGFTVGGNGTAGDARRALEAMNAALVHRGPDEEGTAVHGRAALGMRRLSIVDVDHGQQPMITADGRFALVYNGELYDFSHRRTELERRGMRFATRCDTEVVLQSLAADGVDCLRDFNGMFAFALSDARDGSLLLVRDVIGIKPLYYYHAPDGGLVFSSEIGSLLAHPDVPRRLDHDSLATLLVDRYVPDPYTLVEGVRQLPPGHWLRWREGRVETAPYFEFFAHPEPCDEHEAIAELRRRIDESVRSQLVADVPVAAFLSGGIDSSTVAAFASRNLDRPLHTFTVAFGNPEYDESDVARAVARRLGAEHHELRVENAGFDPSILDAIVRHVGQPLGEPSCIPTLLVSRFAAEHVKVVLSGDGGDEFFGGYDFVEWAGRIRRVRGVPAAVRAAARAALGGATPMARGRLGVAVRRARKGLDLAELEPDEMMRRQRALWQPEELDGLLVETPRPLRPTSCRRIVDADETLPEEHAMDYLTKTTMVGLILRKVDRMSMAASLEVRVPLLDRRVFEYALQLPLSLKIRDGVRKVALREAARDMLPDVVYSHPKTGFAPPLFEWFNDAFWDDVSSACAPGGELARLFRGEALAAVVREGRDAYAHPARVSYFAATNRAWLVAQLHHWLRAYRIAV